MPINFLPKFKGRSLQFEQDGDAFYAVEDDPWPASTLLYRAKRGPKDDGDMEGAKAAREEFIAECKRNNITPTFL